ncbi:receptor-like cytoplasmic kinase 176 [Cornus florida]|uniref:receptor-like cytoplasmic kinase 176 n=1 Tax=Cornus florida TaxID=4283 RepID=UPI0028A12C10|nr:receptor-like cytoplasmic kinase 176 [Cornus florida]
MKVALGVAKGLAYLHSPEAKVIYRVFKSSNILLDSDFNVKLSISESTKVNDEFHIIGYLPPDLCLCNGKEVAYAPPELVITGWSTTKSDTFGFGIVLLEILTGQEAFGYCKFVELVKPYMASKGKTVGVIDPSIEGQYCVGAALRAATIAMHCLRPNSKLRPNMNQVVNALEKLQEPHTTSSFHQVGDGATIER